MKDPFGKTKEKYKQSMALILITPFVLGFAYQLIVPVVYVLGIVSAIWLVRAVASGKFRR